MTTKRPLTSDPTKVIEVSIDGKGGYLVVAVGDNALGLPCYFGEGPRGGQFILNRIRYRDTGREVWTKQSASWRANGAVEVKVAGL